jgi:hypothetical protein
MSEEPAPTLLEMNSRSDARKLMRQVGAKYSGITSYKCRGRSQHRSTFDGNEKTDNPISFEIDYARGRPSFIKWTQDDQKKLLTTSGKAAWLEVDGRRSNEFSTSSDGLTIVGFVKPGWQLFGIIFFVFRDELHVGDRFFLGLREPFTVEKRSEAGHNYSLLTGSFRNVDATQTYWIDEETSLITRIERTLTIRTTTDGKESVSVDRTEETYSDIEIK